MSLVDVTFLGGGPTGLFGVFCAGMRQASSRIIDSLDGLGGQLAALYPEKKIYDVGGFPEILAKDLVGNLTRQMAPFDPEICLGETIRGLEINPDGTLTLHGARGSYPTRSLILTVGIGSFTPRRLEVEGLEAFEGRWVHYSVREKARFQGQRIVIVGGGDSAIDWVLNLQDTARHITLVHRSDKFRALDASLGEVHDLVEAGKVEILTHSVVHGFEGGEGGLQAVTIKHLKGGEARRLEADQLLPLLGYKADLGPLKEWSLSGSEGEQRLTFDGDLIEVDSSMRTGIPKVYAAGDATSYPGKLKLIALGFGEVAIAVASAVSDVRGKKAGTLHSSNLPHPTELKKKMKVGA